MRMPGFTAEESLLATSHLYRTSKSLQRGRAAVIPAACKCDVLEWFFDPLGCAVREFACGSSGSAVSGPGTDAPGAPGSANCTCDWQEYFLNPLDCIIRAL